jgi:hypothetical protein
VSDLSALTVEDLVEGLNPWHLERRELEVLAELARRAERADRLAEALGKIGKGEGASSRDPLAHASNTIDAMKSVARAALAEKEESK